MSHIWIPSDYQNTNSNCQTSIFFSLCTIIKTVRYLFLDYSVTQYDSSIAIQLATVYKLATLVRVAADQNSAFMGFMPRNSLHILPYSANYHF